MSVEEKQELEQMAKGRTLSATIRAQLFGKMKSNEEEARLSFGSQQKLLAQILAELVGPQLSESLRDISQAARILVIPQSEDVRLEINAAISRIKIIRKTLIKALGQKPSDRL